MAKTQYKIQTIICVQVWYVQIWKENNKYAWWINNCIIVLCVPCLISSVHEMGCLGKETVSVSGHSGAQELCNVVQTVTVQRGSVLDVRGPEWLCQPFCSLWISTVHWEWGGLYQCFICSAVHTTLRSLLRSDLVAELNQTVIDVQRTDSMMAE